MISTTAIASSEAKPVSPVPSGTTSTSEASGSPPTSGPDTLKMLPTRPYTRVSNEEKTKDYREMRTKNNQACREWRQKRKKMDSQKDERILQLTAKVLELEQRIAYLNGKLEVMDKK
ncbi:hypothetical protein L596_014608 [Steinernema carpocapsae]|uniref:BZIP domain-containing protein n=1 Tax=Steinernema carpocapsae TaxID=34508 RepID=A0A4U5ND77_STECR|nr:hypothetical protein L596_014608 [Steinernema carpocapsae]